MNKFFTKVYYFVKKNWVALTAFLTTVIVVSLSVLRKASTVVPDGDVSIEPKNDLTGDKVKIAGLEGYIKSISEQIDELGVDILITDEELELSDKTIEKSRNDIDMMTTDEKLKKFDKLGY